MQLGQPKAIRVIDQHDRGIWIVDTDFNYGRCHQYLQLIVLKLLHNRRFFITAHPTMQQSNPVVGREILGKLFIEVGCIFYID